MFTIRINNVFADQLSNY